MIDRANTGSALILQKFASAVKKRIFEWSKIVLAGIVFKEIALAGIAFRWIALARDNGGT